jgi:uncharacterized membrane protein
MRARDYREIARNNLSGKWKTAVWVGFLATLLGGSILGGGSSIDVDVETIAQLPEAVRSFFVALLSAFGFLGLVQFVIGGVVRQGYAVFLLKQHDGQEANVRDLFSQFHDFSRGFLLALLQGLFTFLWTLLFIIPGIIATYRYAMAPYIMAENPGMRPREALRASSELMDGHKWELFCLGFSFIGWTFLAALTLGIGGLWLNPYASAAYTAFYREISGQPDRLPEAPFEA